eukprot:918916-Prorocentrum_lima.AAC.1
MHLACESGHRFSSSMTYYPCAGPGGLQSYSRISNTRARRRRRFALFSPDRGMPDRHRWYCRSLPRLTFPVI